ncbi:D-alanyl-D-alanine carboxypeptidase [Streptomyces sp. BBFR109]|uniref:D-alanyl-D-alanine carboxypeptidase n=1 Tax=Streptomyces sp. BBFR109 TaxID=3448172 RepID=UPI003F776D01
MDTATRVLSVRDLKTAEDSGASEPSGDVEPSGDAEPSGGAEESAGAGDSGASGGDSAGSSGERAEGAGAAGDASGDGESRDGAREGAVRDGDAVRDDEPDGVREGDEEPEAAESDASAGGPDRASDDAAPAAKDDDAEAEAESEPEAASEAKKAGSEPKSEGAETDVKDAEDATGEAEKDGAAADAKPAAKTSAAATPETAPESAPASEAESDPASEPEARPGSASKPDPVCEPDPAAEHESAAKSAPESGTDSASEAEPDAKSDTKAQPKPDAKSEPKPDTKAESNAKAKHDPVSGAEPESKPEPEPASKPESDAKSAPPVDQPTAIFKAPKPPVDQPTTMLKLGGAEKGGKAGTEDGGKGAKKGAQGAPKSAPADTAAGGKSTPESEAERTSKFVALKPLDDPATRRPPKARPDADAAPPQPKDAPGKPSSRPKADPAVTAAIPAAAPVGPERTTQQPLPPKPPLDLLAELTNTPPPPETPLRTTMRRVKIWTPLVVLLLIVFAIAQSLRPLPEPGLQLTAKESHTFAGGKLTLPWPGEGQGWMDVNGVGTMDHFGEQKPAAIGSVAKTMTAYIILRDHPLKPGEEGPKIKVDATAEKEGGYDKGGESTLNTVKAGDFLTEKQALSAVMIPSANNIARLLARWDAGSEAAFVEKMNAAAKELGMTRTTYTDPSGLKETTVSTAQDQVKLGNAVVKNPALVAITSAASWTDPSGRNWPNYNSLPYWIGAIGIKTGTTTAAGGNLLFAARKKVGGQTVTVVGAILGQHKTPILDTVNAVSKTALLGAEKALTAEKIMKKGDVVGYVDDRLGGHTPVVVTEDVTAVGWAGSVVKLSFTADAVPHTAKAGAKVGTLTVGDGGASGAIRVPVALQKDLAEPGFTAKLTRIG